LTHAGVTLPGAWLGLLGGGQLGRMFCMAAQRLGYRVCVLDPGADSPAGAVADDHLRADYLDETALRELAHRCRAVTTEFENVPAAALRLLAGQCVLRPAAAAVAVAQDRIREKRFLVEQGVPVGAHAVIERPEDFEFAHAPQTLYPAILKGARLGYDGKGQARVADRAQAVAAWNAGGRRASVLEQRLDLRCELSVIVCRDAAGATVEFPVAENAHRDGILAVTVAPARVDAALAGQARALAARLAAALDYVGVLCVEMFVVGPGDRLLVNEIAPRPHNSGHFTIDACVTSQFEQQARILAGMPLGGAEQTRPAVMLNLLGELWFDRGARREPPWAEVLRVDGAKLHLYGKSEPRAGRKMGHVTMLGATLDTALARAAEVARILGLPAPR
jgi:5-(carboxyamino)imidazole ribonucleotide synthase